MSSPVACRRLKASRNRPGCQPQGALDPDRISGIDDVRADAVTYKSLAAPLTKAQLDELVHIPERKPPGELPQH